MRAVMSALLLAASASAHALGTWETTLQPRDLNGDGVTDAYYETSGNLTWLSDKSLFTGQYLAAKSWAAGLNVGGGGGWRLPTLNLHYRINCIYGPPYGCDYNNDTTGSELAHLFIDVLGDLPRYDFTRPDLPNLERTNRAPFNVGPFSTLTTNMSYWGGEGPFPLTEAEGHPLILAPIYYPDSGLRDLDFISITAVGWAVHEGDIGAPIPEPGTWALLVAGLTTIGLFGRGRRRQHFLWWSAQPSSSPSRVSCCAASARDHLNVASAAPGLSPRET